MRSPAKAISAPTAIWRFSSLAEGHDPAAYAQLAASLAPLGITRNDKGEADGTDIEPTIATGARGFR